MTLASYLISIAGISIATVMIEAILPEGNMAGFVRRISALIVVFVIIAPIPSLIKKKEFSFGIGQVTSGQGSLLHNDLLTEIYQQRAAEVEAKIEKEMEQNEVKCDVHVSIDLFLKEFEISYVSVRIIEGKLEADSIKRIIKKYVNIGDERIFVL